MLRFSKVPAADMVDAHFTRDNPRVTVKPEEFPTPIYPEQEEIWQQMGTVIDEVGDAKTKSVRRSGVAACFEKAGLNRADLCAESVHNDWPSDLALMIAKDVKSGFRDLGLPGVFTDKVVLLNSLIAKAAHHVSANSFCAKAHFLVPRPEEVVGAIARGEISCPQSITARLVDLPGYSKFADDQRTFTMYPEGCPPHGSYPAMHSGVGGATGTIIKLMRDVTAEEKAEIDLGIINIGMWRSTAGVHWPQDNYVGFWNGQLTVERFIVDELVSLGADRVKVEAAVVAAHTDWLDGTGLSEQ